MSCSEESESEDVVGEEKVFTSTEDEQSGEDGDDDCPEVLCVMDSPKQKKSGLKNGVRRAVAEVRKSPRTRKTVPEKNKGASEQSVVSSEESEVEEVSKNVFTSSDSDSESPKVVKEVDSPGKKKKGRSNNERGQKEEDAPATAAGGIRWKLRSTAKRSSKSTYCEDTSSEEEESESDDFQNDSESEEERPRKRKAPTSSPENSTPSGKRKYTRKSASLKKKKSSEKTKNGSIKSIALYFGGKPPQSKEEKEREIKRRKIDPATRAFLASGVPDVVIKAQKIVEKKKEENAFLSTVAFFPRISFVANKEDAERLLENNDHVTHTSSFPLKQSSTENTDGDITIQKMSCFRRFIAIESEPYDDMGTQLCCPSLSSQLVFDNKKVFNLSDGSEELPWIERFKVDCFKDLVCDSKSLSTFAQWLKQWKTDIKDDGGASRKVVKRKRRDSDSDFITSDDEGDEFKKKSVLLAGPPGCGKTTAVYVTAKHYGFHVVEVNFSSRRSGKEVMQRVEEAVLSHRVESSSNCLLLFKDIDLVDNEEDEGFYAAVAQLIATAVRPIVMTTSKEVYSVLDPKLEKKDPLKICFEYPKSSTLVNRVLMPIIKLIMEKDMKDENTKNSLKSFLQSISLHARCDIRQVINQVQVLLSCNTPITKKIIHQHSIQQNRVVDLGFIQANKQYVDIDNDLNEEEGVCLTVKARRKKKMTDINNICESLEALGDMDFVDGICSRINKCVYDEDDALKNEKQVLKSMYSNPNFKAVVESKSKDCEFRRTLSKLTFDSEAEVVKSEGIYKLGDEVAECLDFPYSEGAWETAACLRTIVKRNMMDSVGRLAKRNGRLTCYFNRLDRRFIDRICQSFSYDQELEMAKGILQDCS